MNDCGVMGDSDLRFPRFPTLGWFVSFGENGLWILLECILLVIVTRLMISLKLVFSWSTECEHDSG